jgi:dipeptidyl aminopeptidase/acylaminoacyl peptidase
MRADGSDVHRVSPTEAQDYAWSPVEDRLAYLTYDWTLCVVEEDALAETGPQGEGRVLIRAASEEQSLSTVRGLAWSPDGQRLAYVLESGPAGPQRDLVSIGYIDPASGPRELYVPPSPPQDGLILAGWTPDGQSVLFWRDLMFSASAAADGLPLLRVALDGGNPVDVADFTLLHPDFWSGSPDGQHVALTVGAGRETWTNKRIALVDLETDSQETLTGEDVAAFSPAFSPDRQQIVYVAGPDIGFAGGGDAAKHGAAQRRIWVMNADGSDQRPLTRDPSYRDERPLWSAGGSHLLFARLDEDGRASLWLMDVMDGALGQVVGELTPAPEWFGYYGHVDWARWFAWWTG